MRLYLNLILTVIAVSLIIIIFKTTDILPNAHAHNSSPVPVKIVGIRIDPHILGLMPGETTYLPVEIVSIKKPKITADFMENKKIEDCKWNPISVEAN